MGRIRHFDAKGQQRLLYEVAVNAKNLAFLPKALRVISISDAWWFLNLELNHVPDFADAVLVI